MKSSSCIDCGDPCSHGSKRCLRCFGSFQSRPIEPPSLENLLARAAEDEHGCLIWNGAVDGKGYGNVGSGRNYGAETKNWTAHRLVYTLAVGPVPEGHDLHHICGVKRCVNPDHLEALTRREHQGKGGRHADHMTPAIRASVEARRRRAQDRFSVRKCTTGNGKSERCSSYVVIDTAVCHRTMDEFNSNMGGPALALARAQELADRLNLEAP